MAYGNFKGLTRRTASDKILRDKVFNIARNPRHDEYQRDLALMVYIFFDKIASGGDATLANKSAKLLLKLKICQTKNKLKNYTN